MRWWILLGIWAWGVPIAVGAQALPPDNPSLPAASRAANLALHAEDQEARGEYQEAAETYLKAAGLTPDDWSLWDRAGWAFLEMGDPKRALEAFEQAGRVDERSAARTGGVLIARFGLKEEGALLASVRKRVGVSALAEAEMIIKRGLAVRPGDTDWWYALGYLYARVLGSNGRAAVPLETVVLADPKRAEAWLLLADVNRALNDLPRATAAAVQYLALAPDTAEAFRLRAERFFELQRMSEAAAEVEEGLKKHPGAWDLYPLLARAREMMGEPREAEEALARWEKQAREAAADPASKTDPDEASRARLQLGMLLGRRGEYARAEPIYREAAERPDIGPTVLGTWAGLLALTERWAESAAAYERAAALQAEDREDSETLPVRYRAALARMAAGDRDAARSVLTSALAGPGERTGARLEAESFLAWLSGTGPLPKALEYRPGDERWAGFTWRSEPPEGEFEVRTRFSIPVSANRALLQQIQKRYPDSWPAQYALARVFASAGYSDDAVRLLRQAASSRGDFWALHFPLGQHYARERRQAPGLAALRRVLELAPECRAARVYLQLLGDFGDRPAVQEIPIDPDDS
jgi:tetratricopeptide (TPR) repeat protein